MNVKQTMSKVTVYIKAVIGLKELRPSRSCSKSNVMVMVVVVVVVVVVANVIVSVAVVVMILLWSLWG